MVIKRCNKNGEQGIDWPKTLIVVVVFAGIITFSLKLSVEANALSRENKVSIDNLKTSVQKLIDLHMGK